MFGLHPKIGFWPCQYINIPYWPHRIIVIGRGRLTKKGKMRHWQPCCHTMHLNFCCDKRIAERRTDG